MSSPFANYPVPERSFIPANPSTPAPSRGGAPATRGTGAKRGRKPKNATANANTPQTPTASQQSQSQSGLQWADTQLVGGPAAGSNAPRPPVARSTSHKHARDTPVTNSKHPKSGKAIPHHHEYDGEESEVEAELDEEEDSLASELDDSDLGRDDPKTLQKLFDAEKSLVIDNHLEGYADDDENENENDGTPSIKRLKPTRTHDDSSAVGKGSKTSTAGSAEPRASRGHSPHSPALRPSESSDPSVPSKRTRGTSDSEVEKPRRHHKDVRPLKKKLKVTSSSDLWHGVTTRTSDNDLDENISDSDPNIELVQPAKAGHKLGLFDQHPRVRKTSKLAMKMNQSNLLLHNAFPDGPYKYTDFDIKTRLKRDADYAHDLASLPVQRISTFRGKVKGLTDQAVSKPYDLDIGSPAHVNWLKTGLP
ncbi:hypothetical protein K466DRAFT_606865 [Polyporus arcularius HHB13444]|uniref:Uncharacterized protein n=1 Tax=Polyporus arcularius HHB13444 TaxID=1314778 RepID=A0A5C3NPP5_9APHY|nr:hypothetical protein K466DRAFT_606865 [Polyporus arcularius HHB13444]